jgi:prepilin-type N-terminal cleavage/methylation domain-containing protein
MKSTRNQGFTLVEMLTVMLIIGILAAIVLNVHGFVNAKAAKARADGEIHSIAAACEAYKGDNGSYPRLAKKTEGDTGTTTAPNLKQSGVPLNPQQNGNPTKQNYKDSSQYLYGQLSGDWNYNGKRDNAPDPSNPTGGSTMEPTGYMPFKPDQLARVSQSSTITALLDPYGNSYGYSTAAALDEECFQANLKASGPTSRPSTTNGFNSTFDLWSTGGRTTDPSSGADPNTVWAKWIKNW